MRTQASSGHARSERSELPLGELTLVFTDIEGSTRLVRLLGPGFAELLHAHHEIVRRCMTAHGGTIVRSEGDAFFCVFSEAAGALAACVEAQLELARHPWPEQAPVKVRMGLHTGTVEPGGDDYIGLAIHQAARVADAGHGGQTLCSEATRKLIGDRLPAGASLAGLGRYRLKDFPEPALLFQLFHEELANSFPALRALPAAAHNLPEQATMFVGRRTALAELAELVRTKRVVTLTGAGGVGKTRLATEVVPLLVQDFPDGVWMVELAALRAGQAVAGEVAATLSVREQGDLSAERLLIDALAAKRLLLLLDNCEHVLDEAAGLVESLVGACPGVHVLATSREQLALAGESRYPLAPLSLPEAAAGADPDASEAVALFVDRARVVAPAFDFERDRAAVVEICRRLDGLPLAIELAAARAASIPPVRMAARLDRRFSVLHGSRRGRLAHHETLRASIEWSYELLEPEERVLLARLAVFAGEFELEAAEEICGYEPLDPYSVLDQLARLIEKSLVQAAGERYVMLESIREFARERLAAAAEVEELVTAHLRHYATVVEVAARGADGPWQRQAYERLDANLPNIRAAVERALERADPAAPRMAADLCQYGFMRNRLREVAHWCIDAAAISDAPAALRARALNQAGFSLVLLGSPDGGQALVDDALGLARAAGDELLLAETLLMAADLRLEAGRDGDARPFAAEAMALVRGLGDDSLLGRALLASARTEQDTLGARGTGRRLSEALEVYGRAGDRRQIGRVLLNRAFVWLEAGELAEACSDAERCVEICEELEHAIGRAMARLVVVWAAIARGEDGRAQEICEECLATARDCGYRALLGYCLAAQATLRARAGDAERAARMLGALAGSAETLGGEGGRVIALRLSELRAELAERLGDELTVLLAEGACRPLDELAGATA